MARTEFPRAVRVAAIKRATKGGNVFCEECGSLAKTWEIDHIDVDGMTGKPVLENAKILCKPCHTEKSRADVEAIARAKRVEAKAIRAVVPAASIKSAPMPTTERAAKRQSKPQVLRQFFLYRDVSR